MAFYRHRIFWRQYANKPALNATVYCQPNAPPRFIRAVVYDYHFTDFNTAGDDGAWWQRGEPRGLYAPVLSLPEQ